MNDEDKKHLFWDVKVIDWHKWESNFAWGLTVFIFKDYKIKP